MTILNARRVMYFDDRTEVAAIEIHRHEYKGELWSICIELDDDMKKPMRIEHIQTEFVYPSDETEYPLLLPYWKAIEDKLMISETK